MSHDAMLNIAVGRRAGSKTWQNKKILWSAFVERLRTPYYTNETLKEFLAATKDEQGAIKDVGGYVGGYLRNGRRKPENVVSRQLLTLDVDFATSDFWDTFSLLFGCSAILHGTHKHCEESPRYRLIIPLNREVTPDEYSAISRYVAGCLDIELFDDTTFEVNRLMFWQSTPKDARYYFVEQDGEWLDADACLASYVDWTDASLWPISDRKKKEIHAVTKKQEDPETKRGVIGAFCRAYSISEAIETYLSDEYTPTTDGRYTYSKGSTASGLITYDDKFAYSHHGSDPCSAKLCNAFDLVRIHRFGHLDTTGQDQGVKANSFKAMEDFARQDKSVKKLIASESLEGAKYDFKKVGDDEVDDFYMGEDEAKEEESLDWATDLEVDSKGKYLSTASNINIILANDPRLKGKFQQNDFDGKRYACGSLPWRKLKEPEAVKNVDYSGVRNYIETIYGISGNLKIDDSLALEFEKHSFHPIKDYLKALKWDGESRIDSILIDYFGVTDNIYTREAMRKMLVAAVARIFVPGIKFDLVLTLVGEQGTGKSTMIKKLGKSWFSDTFMTVQGKEALEQIQGVWLLEMAELAGLKKAEVETVKHFISKQEDQYRPAYARTSETYKRQCVFFGTTNNKDFLRDPTGNRRFMPVDIEIERATKSIFTEFESEVDQIWAEAVVMFKAGEPLMLSQEAEAIARQEQFKHSEIDERAGMVEQYLEAKLPKEWPTFDIYSRRNHLSDPIAAVGEVRRDYVCTAELWCECLGKDKADMGRYTTKELNDIMKSLDGWEYVNSTKNFPIYGKQKFYKRRT